MKPNLEQAIEIAKKFFAKFSSSSNEIEFELENGKTIFILRNGKVSRKATYPSLP